MWWTLRRSKPCPRRVTLVLHESLFEEFSELERTFGSAGAKHVVPGGPERFFHSVLEGLKTLPDEGVVGIHDAVRPFPSVEAIQRCLSSLRARAVPSPWCHEDSIRRVEEAGSEAVDRGALRAVQTPQCFDLATLKAAFDTPYRPEFTDDASVYEAAGHTVNLCEGDPWNVKVTTPEDLTIAEAFVRLVHRAEALYVSIRVSRGGHL